MPQPLSNGRNVYEELGHGFTLLALDADETAIESFERAAATTGIPFKIIRDSFRKAREEYKHRLVLVRPDQHVVWAGRAAPADTAGLLRKAAGLL